MTLGAIRNVAVRAVEPADLEAIYALETDPMLGSRSRFDRSVSPEEFLETMTAGLFVGSVVERRPGREILAYGFAYGYSPRTNSVDVGIIGGQHGPAGADALVGFALFLNYLFEEYGLDRVLAWTSGATIGQFRSAIGPVFTEFATLSHHAEREGERLQLIGVDRESWFSSFRPLVVSRTTRTTQGVS